MPDGPSILVVDDDQDIRETLFEVFIDEGFNTDAVSNGEQALQWLRAHPGEKCVVLLDLMMPVMTGWEFLKVRERDPLLLETPVLVMTAAGVCKEIRTQFHHLLACVPKPFSLEAVLKIVDASCRQ